MGDAEGGGGDGGRPICFTQNGGPQDPRHVRKRFCIGGGGQRFYLSRFIKS